MFKQVRLLKDRGGDKAGGVVSVPAGVADDLVAGGAAEPCESPGKAAPAAPSVPQAEFDKLRRAVEELTTDYLELQATNEKLADAVKAAEADRRELQDLNEHLAAKAKKLEADLAAKPTGKKSST